MPDCGPAGGSQAALRNPVAPVVHGLQLSLGHGGYHSNCWRRPCGWSADILEQVRGSPPWSTPMRRVGDGWTHTATTWTFSTPNLRYFCDGTVAQGGSGPGFGRRFRRAEGVSTSSGVLVSDFYAAYHHYAGPKQRCWAHLLRDIHDLRSVYPDDGSWPSGMTPSTNSPSGQVLYPPRQSQRRTAKMALERSIAGPLPALPG